MKLYAGIFKKAEQYTAGHAVMEEAIKQVLFTFIEKECACGSESTIPPEYAPITGDHKVVPAEGNERNYGRLKILDTQTGKRTDTIDPPYRNVSPGPYGVYPEWMILIDLYWWFKVERKVMLDAMMIERPEEVSKIEDETRRRLVRVVMYSKYMDI